MSIKIGVSPIAWSNDDFPELGGETSLDECLKEAREIGFVGIESGGKFPKNSNELIPKLNKFDLKLCSGWYGANLLKNTVNEEWANMKSQVKLFKDCSAPCIAFCEVTNSIQGKQKIPLSKRPTLGANDWKNFYKKINDIGLRLEDSGVLLAYHHHMGTVVQSQQDTERLMDNTKENVKLLLDTGHMMFAGGNSVQIAEKYFSKLIHVHCKDIRKIKLDNALKNDCSFIDAFFDGTFTVPGDGYFDYKPLFEILKKLNYNGWLVVEAEQDPKKANPFKFGKIGYDYLKNLSLEVGLK
jgi:inosose dehydratase